VFDARIKRCLLVGIGVGTATAHAEPRVEVGGYGGWSSAKTLTYDCTQLLGTGDASCSDSISEPHNSEGGIALGAYVRYAVHPAVLLEADLLYAQKGENTGTHTTYHYIEAPLLARVDPVRPWSHARVFAYAGLAPAIRIACTTTGMIFDNDTHMPIDYSGSCQSLPVPLNDRVPSFFDLGLVIGAGFGYEISFGTIELQVRYTRGLIDTQDEGGETINRASYFLVGYGRFIGH